MKDQHPLQDVYDYASFLPKEYREELEKYYSESEGSNVWKLQSFTKYVPRQSITRFLVRYEIFKKILPMQGSIVEIGVLDGASLMAWAQFSAIFEHLNHQRKIIGFDMFGDKPQIGPEDHTGINVKMYEEGKMSLNSFDDIKESIRIFDKNRFLGSQEKVILVKGNVKDTAPEYLKSNPETIVSLLYLDVNLYEPTKAALDTFLPRMPKGSVIVFDELNDRGLPGETLAVIDSIDLKTIQIERFSFDTKISYAVL
ncbi:MAG TPA: TylF/MycF/NovP-related O-methyltransferase [Oligoflexia bacterium]|nr:TylF/MycF/NovP-related O-methyltransferase [Oligoflexia bacterium]HMP48508.1 TylF/MycF/NovP-related O-methyltransferase [Oligoflexia bacterium]